MIRCGLMPSHTGKPKGKQTGSYMLQYPLQDRPFIWACNRLFAEGFKLHWESKEEKLIKESGSKKPKIKNRNKVKYTCPWCQQNCWAKPNANFYCGDCYDRLGRMKRMVPKTDDNAEEEELASDLTRWTDEELNSLDFFPISIPPVRTSKNDAIKK